MRCSRFTVRPHSISTGRCNDETYAYRTPHSLQDRTGRKPAFLMTDRHSNDSGQSEPTLQANPAHTTATSISESSNCAHEMRSSPVRHTALRFGTTLLPRKPPDPARLRPILPHAAWLRQSWLLKTPRTPPSCARSVLLQPARHDPVIAEARCACIPVFSHARDDTNRCTGHASRAEKAGDSPDQLWSGSAP